jgi:hypothetical protein
MVNNEFAGLNGFVWWIGVVEDRTDPLKLGRCRVRIAGWHSEKVTELPTNNLPWAQAMMPVNNPNTYTPKESDMVVGFFLDGENAQQPIIMGVLPGIPLVSSNEKTGFGDTRTSKQIEIAPAKPGQDKTSYPRYLDEPTTSRLARNEQPTQIDLLNQLASSSGNKYGVEKSPSYNAKYPYNNAIETESGHAFELDDTPNYERINLMHRGGSHLEFRPEGSVQQKIMNNSTRMIGKDEVVHIKGNQLIYIDGDLTYKVGGSVTFQVEKDFAVSATNISFNARGSWSGSAKISASLSGIISSSLGGITTISTSVAGVKTSVSGLASLDATSRGKATFGGSATLVNGATIALVNTPASGGESPSSKTEPPAEGSPFTSPTTTPETNALSESAIDNATATYGVPNPDAATIIGKSVSDQSYLNNVIYGSTNYNWTNASQITQSMSVVNPTFAEALKADLQNGLTAAKDFGTKLGSDLYNQSGLPGLEKSYVDASARIDVALQTGKLSDYSKAASATVDVIGKGAQVSATVVGFNRDVINASDFVKNSCIVKTGKQWVKDVAQPITDGFDKVKSELKDIDNKIKDMDPKLKDRLSELRKSMDSFDEKALDEFVNANHKDQACQFCAQEASEKLKNGVDRKTVSEGVSNCLYREYVAFKKTYASKLPITDKKAADNLNNNC